MPPSGRSADRAGVTTVVVVAVVAAVLVAGALWLVAAPEATSRPIGTDAADRHADVDGVTATETRVVRRGGETTRTVADVAFRPGTEQRREHVVTGETGYDLTVSNGSVMWMYDSGDDVAKRVPLSETPGDGVARGERVERLFTALNVTQRSAAERASSPEIEPLPVVPGVGGGPNASADATVGAEYDGTERVDGREAYVLRVTSRDDSANYEQTLWVDTEHFVVLKQQTEWVDDGVPVSVTRTYSNVSVNPGLDEGAFELAPSGNTTVERVETPETTAYESVGALREVTDVSVPSPDVPPSFRLTYASETTGDVHGVGLRYVNETARVTLAKYDRTFPASGDETVAIGDHEGAVTYGPTTSVSWNCGEYRYTVRGQGVPASLLVEFARSVGCE